MRDMCERIVNKPDPKKFSKLLQELGVWLY